MQDIVSMHIILANKQRAILALISLMQSLHLKFQYCSPINCHLILFEGRWTIVGNDIRSNYIHPYVSIELCDIEMLEFNIILFKSSMMDMKLRLINREHYVHRAIFLSCYYFVISTQFWEIFAQNILEYAFHIPVQKVYSINP